MPSRDKINKKANEWMEADGISSPVAPKPKIKQKRQMSAHIMGLAKRLGEKPDDLVKRYSDDTVRRTKYPVRVVKNPDGTRTYEHDLGIKTDAVRS